MGGEKAENIGVRRGDDEIVGGGKLRKCGPGEGYLDREGQGKAGK
jgi:hypothetical protein